MLPPSAASACGGSPTRTAAACVRCRRITAIINTSDTASSAAEIAINLLPISAALLAVSLVLMIAVIRLQRTQAAAVRVGEPPQADAALGGSIWAAFGQVDRKR